MKTEYKNGDRVSNKPPQQSRIAKKTNKHVKDTPLLESLWTL